MFLKEVTRMPRGLLLFQGHERSHAMRASRTHFEQIPLEVVKKIAEGGLSRDEKTSADRVILEWTPGKRKPRTAPARSRAKKER